MLHRIFILAFVFISTFVFAQDSCEIDHVVKQHFLEQESFNDSLNYYRKLFRKTKKISKKDDRLELAFYVALRHYPELKKTKIKVRFKKIKSTMVAQPEADFIVKSKNDRRYKIILNSTKENIGMNYEDLTFNALVGWLGHELAHITDYSKKSNRQLVQFISNYLFSRKHMKHTEKCADKEAVKRGLGYALYEGVHELFRNPKIFKKYKERNKEFYLTPDEILAEIKRLEKE
jgi:hypothetical protein